MNNPKVKQVIEIVIFAFLLIFATRLSILFKQLPSEYAFIYSFTYILSIGIHISLFFAWTVSVYYRIMQSRVRTYLMLIGVNIILWVGIRAVKWGPLGKVVLGDRIAWYMFYIPMIMIPLLFFFTALCVGEDEHYRPNKKWDLLFVPAVLLIALVLTNDFHLLVFGGFDLDVHMYERAYDHKIGYFIVAIFLVGLILLSTAMIIKKFRYSVSTRKASRLPMLVVGCVLLYTVLLVLGPVYGVEHYFMDVTIFSCTAAVAFWEACIRTGLVHSNSRHKEFFEMATTNAQILTHTGEVVYTSENALPLTQEDFETLKERKVTDYDKNTLLHISPIKGGYVAWSSDVSGMKSAIGELLQFNENLYEEINRLSYENGRKEETARSQKLSELQSILLTETLPHSEKIKNTVMAYENSTLEGMKDLLFEATIILAYLKRKVSLILTEQTEKCISTAEIQRSFLEIFGLLKFYGRKCTINILQSFDMSLSVSVLCFDLFQKVLEKYGYRFYALYVTFNQNIDQTIFTITIESSDNVNADDLLQFETQKISTLKGKIRIIKEPQSYYFSLIFPHG